MKPPEGTSRAAADLAVAERAGWLAALEEIEHQAMHWDTPDHGPTGQLIAEALRSAAAIARSGGLECEHRQAGRR